MKGSLHNLQRICVWLDTPNVLSARSPACPTVMRGVSEILSKVVCKPDAMVLDLGCNVRAHLKNKRCRYADLHLCLTRCSPSGLAAGDAD